MVNDPYRDTELVGLYDLDNPDGEDHAYYRTLADEAGARMIVDLGCGTGLLTRSLARPGRTVIGVDPSRAMLRTAEEFRRELESAGFVDIAYSGGWQGEPVGDRSRILVFRARRAF